jgi:Fe-S-cluster containining protein
MSGNRSCQETDTKTGSIPVFQLRDFTNSSSAGNGKKWVEGTISLYGIQKHVSIQLTNPFSRLSDLVPLAQALCDHMMSETMDRCHMMGTQISCGKGCSACCSYLVPLSIPEVIHLYEEIESLPVDQSSEFWRNSLSVAGNLLEDVSLERPNGDSSVENVGEWYSEKQVSCPLLKNDVCTIYAQRPLACREYLVKTPPQRCHPKYVEQVEKVRLPLSVLESLGQTVAELEGTAVEAIMLPLILPWIEENQDRINRKWSSHKMAQCFLDTLSQESGTLRGII